MNLQLQSCICLTQDTAHNAFTDLVFFDDFFWCAYRKASSHMLLDGQIVVLTSKDGKAWQEFQTIDWAGGDLRDPKFVITHDSKLMMLSGLRMSAFNCFSHRVSSITWYLTDRQQFEVTDTQIGTWRWSGERFDSHIYSVGYSGLDMPGVLYRCNSAGRWQPQVRPFFPESSCFTNETSMTYDVHNKVAYALVRRDGKECNALLGTSLYPFQEWHWRDLDMRIGGPKLLLTDSGNLLAGFRVLTEDSAKMVIAQIDMESASFINYIELPSSGDCSYPGMLLKDNELFVSYYSSHEQTTQVYFAKLSLK